MKKDTIEIFRDKNHRKGYGYMTPPVNETDVLNAIVDWSSDKNVIIYKHIRRDSEENREGVNKGEYGPLGGPYQLTEFPACDYVVYVDIYYQNKI